MPMEQLSILLVLSIGLMGVLTPYATGPGVIIYGCGYVKSKDYWRLGRSSACCISPPCC
ncbi:Citrate/succinate antiporter [Serratia rubidaea]|uniref:Citrate/succinate antiporter n=1 Tax=Serratia rubidaea TaxID=61652 RepID=A0A3S4H2Z9_SERRU|nr:Citrate/succinate antiporter [Serratia rubidaea]